MVWLTLALKWCVKNWRLCAMLAFACVAAAALLYARHHWIAEGEGRIQAKWDASVARGIIALQIRDAQRAKITVKTETVYVDRIRVVHEKGQTIIQRIPAMVPADACLLPAGFRLSHDHAAAGTVPDAAASAYAGAAEPEAIAWRPWDSSAGAASRHHRGRELQLVSPARRTAARFAGMDSRAGGR